MTSMAGDLDSTLIRRATKATTLSEMQLFVDTIQHRPLDKLLADLPGLARLSDMKFTLARQVLRRRMAALDPMDREQLRVFGEEVASGAGPSAAERIRRIFV